MCRDASSARPETSGSQKLPHRNWSRVRIPDQLHPVSLGNAACFNETVGKAEVEKGP